MKVNFTYNKTLYKYKIKLCKVMRLLKLINITLVVFLNSETNIFSSYMAQINSELNNLL